MLYGYPPDIFPNIDFDITSPAAFLAKIYKLYPYELVNPFISNGLSPAGISAPPFNE
jgi:hypothetical protein